MDPQPRTESGKNSLPRPPRSPHDRELAASKDAQDLAEAGARQRQEEDRNEEDAVKDMQEDAEDARQDAEPSG